MFWFQIEEKQPESHGLFFFVDFVDQEKKIEVNEVFQFDVFKRIFNEQVCH